MTKETLAAMLDGREIGDETTDMHRKSAKQHGLVIVFGYSDDCIEFEGAISDELGASDKRTFFVHRKGLLTARECVEFNFMHNQTIAAPDERRHAKEEALVQGALQIIRTEGIASIPMFQRMLGVGPARAKGIMDILENRGIVGPSTGAHAREIIKQP